METLVARTERVARRFGFAGVEDRVPFPKGIEGEIRISARKASDDAKKTDLNAFGVLGGFGVSAEARPRISATTS